MDDNLSVSYGILQDSEARQQTERQQMTEQLQQRDAELQQNRSRLSAAQEKLHQLQVTYTTLSAHLHSLVY